MRKRSRYRPRLVGAPLTSAIVAMFREQIVDCQLRLHYAAEGFESIARRDDYYPASATSPREDALVLRRDLVGHSPGKFS